MKKSESSMTDSVAGMSAIDCADKNGLGDVCCACKDDDEDGTDERVGCAHGVKSRDDDDGDLVSDDDDASG